MNRRHGQKAPIVWTPERVGLDPAKYASALRYLFERPVPQGQQEEWYWNADEPEFEATPLEWTRIQAVLFANAGGHLEAFDNEQVGMGLNYLMNNAISNVPFAVIDPSVPQEDAMLMMQAMPSLWRHCIGPRLAKVHQPIGSSRGVLEFVCYMWFDVWPTFSHVRHLPSWQEALWQVFKEMLDTPCREVQIAALHGIGHNGLHLGCQARIEGAVNAFILQVDVGDEELKNYAVAARQGTVQ